MSDAAGWSLAALAALATSLAVVSFVERQASRLGLVDLPNMRSSHVQPRPRGGGLGIVAGVVVGAVIATFVGQRVEFGAWIVLGGSLMVACVGLWDDIRGLGVWPRLAVQTIAAIIVVTFAGSADRLPLPSPADLPLGPVAPLATVIWIVGVTNFFNFMDGLDGLAAGQALITLAAIACVAWPADAAGVAIVAAAASVGFLLRNWPPARIFLGDVGSAFLGFLLAALPLTVDAPGRSPLVGLVWISLALFLLDPIATLIARARRGAVVGASHREHAYQQFVAPSASHAPIVTRLLAVATGLSAFAVAAAWDRVLAWPAVAAAVIAFAVEWRLAAARRPRSA